MKGTNERSLKARHEALKGLVRDLQKPFFNGEDEPKQDEQAINAQNILEREVDFFLNTLKDRHAFIVRKVAQSKEFKNFKKERTKETPSLFAYDGAGTGEGLFALFAS